MLMAKVGSSSNHSLPMVAPTSHARDAVLLYDASPLVLALLTSAHGVNAKQTERL